MDFFGFDNLDFSVPIAVGVLLGVIFAVLLNYALFKYIIHEVIQQIHTYGNGWDNILRTILYCILTNAQFLVIGFMACLKNPIVGISMCLESDFLMILVTAGVIVYIQQSRQTKLDPFLFCRDLGFYVFVLFLFLIGILIKYTTLIPILLIVFGCVYLILQYLNHHLQYKFYKLFNLNEDEDFMTPQLLQTQQRSKPNIHELQKIITEQPQVIHKQVDDFFKLVNRAVPKERDRRMYRKFAQIAMPIVKAIQIKAQRDKTKRSQMYAKHWISKQNTHNLPQPQFLRIDELSQNSKSSYAPHTVVRGMTMQVQQEQQNLGDKIIKIIFYPLYFISKLNTDMKYVLYILCLGVEIILLLFINSGCHYLGKRWAKPQLFEFILSHLLTLPNVIYFIRVSEGGDHDFYNLFLQSGIWKVTIGLSIMQILNISVGTGLEPTMTHKIYMAIKLGMMLIFTIFCGVRKLNIKKESIKYTIGIFVVGYIGSIILMCF